MDASRWLASVVPGEHMYGAADGLGSLRLLACFCGTDPGIGGGFGGGGEGFFGGGGVFGGGGGAGSRLAMASSSGLYQGLDCIPLDVDGGPGILCEC